MGLGQTDGRKHHVGVTLGGGNLGALYAGGRVVDHEENNSTDFESADLVLIANLGAVNITSCLFRGVALAQGVEDSFGLGTRGLLAVSIYVEHCHEAAGRSLPWLKTSQARAREAMASTAVHMGKVCSRGGV